MISLEIRKILTDLISSEKSLKSNSKQKSKTTNQMIKSQQSPMGNWIRNKQIKVRKKLEILFLEMILNKINRKLIKKKNNQILKK